MFVNDVQTQDLGKGADPPPIVTLMESEQIKMGTGYLEVVDILGDPGVSNLRATLQNDQLAERSQLYLK